MAIGKMDLTKIIPIVKDGAIANPDLGEGRLIPVLILDCDNRRDVWDMVMMHEHTPPGDVKITWGQKALSKKKIYLTLDFEKPMPTSVVIEFDMQGQGGLVDFIISARAFYLQPKDSGLSVSEGVNNPKILVEVPILTKLKTWENIYFKSIAKVYKKQGVEKSLIKEMTQEHISRLRELSSQFRARNKKSNIPT